MRGTLSNKMSMNLQQTNNAHTAFVGLLLLRLSRPRTQQIYGDDLT
jgi:hypothetical protein